MSHAPAALDPGVVLHGRFQIAHSLGRGGFGITYLAHDTERKDSCVVKELAPPGAVRTADGDLSFAVLGPAIAQRLRHQFCVAVFVDSNRGSLVTFPACVAPIELI